MPPVLGELTESLVYADFATSASASVREALGLGSLHVCSTQELAIRKDPSHFFNRAGGFGTDGPITVDDLVQVRDFSRKQGASQGSLMIAPPWLPPGLGRHRRETGPRREQPIHQAAATSMMVPLKVRRSPSASGARQAALASPEAAGAEAH
ncbi:hypothetical protein [Streptomyces sp. NRRL S-337]|uniref:hypothetical protein n=1 Tax=Streptomyces sp. NRRL S-337 TaxID=1463900 RepID=UPI00068B2EC7|nr:hypothetical protein [Streptomyces sp. NRRL S-337]